jgi:PIN domain nuclease of toxin-antitoxin system
VRLLLDTHAFVWWDDNRLPPRVTSAIKEADEVFVSAVVAWEIAIKSALGKIVVRGSVAEAIDDYGFSALPVTVEHADAVRLLPLHHRDPFDRLLVIQAQIGRLTLVSHDPAFAAYDVAVLWSGRAKQRT